MKKLIIPTIILGLIAAAIPLSSIKASSLWRTSVENTDASAIKSFADGGVAAFNCSSANTEFELRQFSEEGSESGSIATTEDSPYYFCNDGEVASQNGVVYATKSLGRYGSQLVALKNGEEVWSHAFITDYENPNDDDCNSELRIESIKIAGNGNIYVALNEGWPWCYNEGYLGAITPEGEELFLKRYNRNEIRSMRVHQDGVALQHYWDKNQIRYHDLDGNEVASYQVAPSASSDYVVSTFVDDTGRTYGVWAEKQRTNSSCSLRHHYREIKIFAPQDGLQATYPIATPCSSVETIATGSFGAAILVKHRLSGSEFDGEMIILDKNGEEVLKQNIPKSDGDKSYYKYFPKVESDVNSNIVYTRKYSEMLDGRYPRSPNMEVKLINPYSGQEISSYDTRNLSSDPENGFMVYDTTFHDGQLYLLGEGCHDYNRCWETGAEKELVSIDFSLIGAEYPRSALKPSIDLPEKTAYFLGDSFMAGEGIEPFGSSDEDQMCHRSESAWPRIIGSHNIKIDIKDFIACSGAQISDILHGRDKQPQQIERLESKADIAIISIGGNDIEFSKLIYTCLLLDCQDRQEYTGQLIDQLDAKFETLISTVKSKLGNDVEIYFTGYPYVLPMQECSTAALPIRGLSTLIRESKIGNAAAIALGQSISGKAFTEMDWTDIIDHYGSDSFTFSEEEAIEANIITGRLNNRILRSTTSRGAEFINMNGLDSPFRGHELCTDAPYFNAFNLDIELFDVEKTLANFRHSYHPNLQGAYAYKQIFEEYYIRKQNELLSN